jgi:hypothetical protein
MVLLVILVASIPAVGYFSQASFGHRATFSLTNTSLKQLSCSLIYRDDVNHGYVTVIDERTDHNGFL